VQHTDRNRSLRQLLQSRSGPVCGQAGTSDTSSASGNKPSWASNRGLRQLLQVLVSPKTDADYPSPVGAAEGCEAVRQTGRLAAFGSSYKVGADLSPNRLVSDISSASGSKPSWASYRSLRQLLQVFSKSENRCRPPIPCRSCRRLRGGAADKPQSQPSAAPTKWERTCLRTGWYIRHIFSVRQQDFVGKRAIG